MSDDRRENRKDVISDYIVPCCIGLLILAIGLYGLMQQHAWPF